jgi:endonuclease/exonuclease/phosphatase family metal-dependent hydrolase
MPKHRAQRSRTAPTAAVLLLATIVILAGRQVDLPDSDGIDRASDVATDGAGQADDDGDAGDAEAASAATGKPSGTMTQKVTRTSSRQAQQERECGPSAVAETLTVASLNIESARSGLNGVTAAIADLDSDIVLLQEVDKFRASSGYVDQPGFISKRLGINSAFGANVLGESNRYGRSQSGTAILSRYRIKEEWTALLPNDRRGPQGVLQHAVLDVNGLELSVYNTHLQSTNDRLRMRQIHAITPILAADNRPTIFGGDLQAQPGSRVLEVAYSVLEDPWAAGVGRGSSVTHPATRPRGRIDYVLHAGESLGPQRADVVAPGISGHRPTRATYTLTGVAGEIRPGSPRAVACR